MIFSHSNFSVPRQKCVGNELLQILRSKAERIFMDWLSILFSLALYINFTRNYTVRYFLWRPQLDLSRETKTESEIEQKPQNAINRKVVWYKNPKKTISKMAETAKPKISMPPTPPPRAESPQIGWGKCGCISDTIVGSVSTVSSSWSYNKFKIWCEGLSTNRLDLKPSS